MITLQQKRILYKKLPKGLQEKISSDESLGVLDAVALRFSLSENQKDFLDSETTLVLMGIVKKNDFISLTEKSLGVDKTKAEEIYHELNRILFSSVQSLIDKAVDEYDLLMTFPSSGKNQKSSAENRGSISKKEVGSDSLLENGNDHLIEDALGNSDNYTSASRNGVTIFNTAPDNLPGLTPIHSPVDEKLSNLVDMQKQGESATDFEKRKQAIAEGEKIVQKAYSDKPDPYRELPI